MKKEVTAAALIALAACIGNVAARDDESPKETKRASIPKVAAPRVEVKKPVVPSAAPRADDESPKETPKKVMASDPIKKNQLKQP